MKQRAIMNSLLRLISTRNLYILAPAIYLETIYQSSPLPTVPISLSVPRSLPTLPQRGLKRPRTKDSRQDDEGIIQPPISSILAGHRAIGNNCLP